MARDSMIDILNEYYGGLDKMPITDHDIHEHEDDIASDFVDEYLLSKYSEESYSEINSKTRAVRRKNSVHKARRKQKISQFIYHDSHAYYDNLHQYSKNKIHCSCKYCAFNHKKKGYVNLPISDMRNIEKMNYDMANYDLAEEAV